MRKAVIFIVLALLLLFWAAPAYAAIPALPHFFYGSVKINGSPAPDGTQVLARVDKGILSTNQNPVTTKGGSYGINSPMLLVQGDISSGVTITFYVKGVKAEGQAAIFEVGGGPTRRDLSVAIVAPPVEGPPTYYTETNLFGIKGGFPISDTGEVQKTTEATSEDGMFTMTIPKGTVALDKDGKPLKGLEAKVDERPPDPPEDAHIIGLAYDFGPDGASFDPPITFTWHYDPDALPEGVAEEDLVIAYYDENAGKWVELDCVVDTKNNVITASVAHFTIFATIGKVRAIVPPPPTITIPPAPPPPPAPTPAPAPPPTPPPATVPAPLPPLPAPVPPIPVPGVNWPLVGGIIAAVIVLIGLLIYFLVFRRRAY